MHGILNFQFLYLVKWEYLKSNFRMEKIFVCICLITVLFSPWLAAKDNFENVGIIDLASILQSIFENNNVITNDNIELGKYSAKQLLATTPQTDVEAETFTYWKAVCKLVIVLKFLCIFCSNILLKIIK